MDEKIAKERAAVERPSNVDPPPPYIKSEFDGVPMASSAPPLEAGPPLGAYPQQIGFAPPGTYPQLPRQDPVPYSNQPHPPYSNQPQPSPSKCKLEKSINFVENNFFLNFSFCSAKCECGTCCWSSSWTQANECCLSIVQRNCHNETYIRSGYEDSFSVFYYVFVTVSPNSDINECLCAFFRIN